MHFIENYRHYFNGIEVPVQLIDGSYTIPINFDNAATTPPFKYVDIVLKESISMYGSIHRGGQKALHSTKLYEASKVKLMKFFNLHPDDSYCIIYTKNTTEALNLLAKELCSHEGTKVLTTRMEHHANDLPWRQYAHVLYVETEPDGSLDLKKFEEKLACTQGTIKYVTVTAASNVTGYRTPVRKLAEIAHTYHAKIIVDAAQLVAHAPLDLKGSNQGDCIDCIVFSAHKMYAPFGTGAIVIKQSLLEEHAPYLYGGGSVIAVFDDDVYYKCSPDKDEAGTPNFLGVMALSGAIDMLQEIGMQKILNHETILRTYLLEGLKSLSKVELYGQDICKDSLAVISFNIQGKHHSHVTHLLADYGGIAVRNGCFCAQPYVARLLSVSDSERYRLLMNPQLPQPGMVRVSLGLYNTIEEIDAFLNVLEWIICTSK